MKKGSDEGRLRGGLGAKSDQQSSPEFFVSWLTAAD